MPFSAHAGDPRQEEAAHRIAWAALKRSYVKIDDNWVSPSRLMIARSHHERCRSVPVSRHDASGRPR
jgi:hypothetical protein